MKTTQIGSLPFVSVEEAVEYALEFDLPFVPTLPKLCEKELMFNLVNFGFNEIDFSPKEICFDLTLKNLLHRRCKYQIMGPVSFQKVLLQMGKMIDWKFIENYLLKKIEFVIEKFSKLQVTPIIFIDEPMLDCSDIFAYEKINEFLKKIQVQKGLHCCSQADWKRLSYLELDYLSLDFYSYKQNILSEIKLENLVRNKFLMFGLICTRSKKYSTIKVELESDKIDVTKHFLTPSCGLGLSSTDVPRELVHENMKLMLK